jgi:hypothetical protein
LSGCKSPKLSSSITPLGNSILFRLTPNPLKGAIKA